VNTIGGNIPALFEKHGTIDMKAAGIASSFKDLFALRKMEPPVIEVCDP
jgi:hypothetical protein